MGLADLKLSATSLAAGEPLVVSAEVRAIGPRPTSPVRVELWLTEQANEVKRGEMVVELPAEEAKPESVQFTLAALPEGVHTGRLTLSTGDGLPIDDSRPFAVEVAPRRRCCCSRTNRVKRSSCAKRLRRRSAMRSTLRRYECAELLTNSSIRKPLERRRCRGIARSPALEPGVWRRLPTMFRRGANLPCSSAACAEARSF